MTAPAEDAALQAWVTSALGSAPVKTLFARHHLSTVYGYRLADGRLVVVKARPDPVARVQACLTLQAGLYAGHFPCPRPLTAPAIVEGLTVHAEEHRDAGTVMLGDDLRLAPAFGTSYGDLLTRLVPLADAVDTSVLTAPPWVGWWRQRAWSADPRVPQTLLAAAAEVRDRLAAVDLPTVVGHADWESQNLRWSGTDLAVAHDWDSLAALPEAVLVGAAASTFPSGDQPVVASIEATQDFLDAYQDRRGRRLTADERRVTWVAGLLPVLFNARVEALERRRQQILPVLDEQVARRLELADA